jgi:5-methylcytosine-specific restriction endonuclease McrA
MNYLKDIDDSAFETWKDDREDGQRRYAYKPKDFYRSKAWQVLRRRTLERYGRECMKCGTTEGVIQVDHIRSRFYYPELSLDPQNLQVLCQSCNEEKGISCRDYRRIKNSA